MTHKVGPKGQVVVPKRIRERLGIHPGDEVIVEEQEGHVEIHKIRSAESLRGSLPPSDIDPLSVLEEEHRRELDAEDRAADRP